MLHLYYGSAHVDKEQFIFDHMGSGTKTLLVVPDQSSLQMERDAFRYTGRTSLMDLMVVDFSSLGHKVVSETCGHEPEIIDKYGRHMLLSILIGQMEDDLTVFRRASRQQTFADQMNTVISEMKRYAIGPDQLEEAMESLRKSAPDRGQGRWLISKLEDILRIYRAYEESIEDVYQDAEDYISFYAAHMKESRLVSDADIWIYGFDTFTPKNLEVIRALLQTARQVSVVLTCEDEGDRPSPVRSLTQSDGDGLFDLTRMQMARLQKVSEEAGRPWDIHKIEGPGRASLWDRPLQMLPAQIRLVQASDIYAEADRAAAYILSLVRDEGYRFGEIGIICNDLDSRGSVLRRTLQRWDIPVFADHKRKVLHQPVAGFLLDLLDIIAKGFSQPALLGLVKSGLLAISDEEEALLENYITQFRIRGSLWKKPFTRDGGGTYTPDQLARLNEIRVMLVQTLQTARDSIGRRNTAAEKVQGLYDFLQDAFRLPEKIQETIERQQALGLTEGAAETAQIWNTICSILQQIVRVIGTRRVSNELLRDMVSAGLSSIEIGLVPVSNDCVSIGTLQRSRPGHIRALIVTGANQGILPLDTPEEGLLGRREKEILAGLDLEFAGKESITQMEEQLAIYRMFSLPSDRLYVSCTTAGSDEKPARPSSVFDALLAICGKAAGDLETAGFPALVSSSKGTLTYLAGALRSKAAGDKVDPHWDMVQSWYEAHDPQALARVLRGIRFRNQRKKLGDALADALYRGDQARIEASASRLELFSGCPFAHFIRYGLRAEEERLFTVGGREIGDLYHRCMMEFSRELSAPGGDPQLQWQTIGEAQCRTKIRDILRVYAAGYREGLFTADGYGTFRMQRVEEICGDIAWTMVQQVRSGAVREMRFEEPFGRGGRIPAIEVDAGRHKVRISGIIDRLDVLDADDGQTAVRVVDYKTGSDVIDVEDFRSGYRLQLMLYMNALGNGESGQVPAGVFYFKIRDFVMDGDKRSTAPEDIAPETLDLEMRKSYRMEGIVVKDPSLIRAQDIHLSGDSSAESMVIPVKYAPKKEDYDRTSGGTLMNAEEFQALQMAVQEQVEHICRRLAAGEIQAVPRRQKHKDADGNLITACRFCDYRSICMFDPSLRGCRYAE